MSASGSTDRLRRDALSLRVSCLGTPGRLPKNPGHVERVYHQGLFRIEHLTVEQVGQAEPVRQEAAFFKARVAAMETEAVAAHAAKPLAEYEEAKAARDFRSPVSVYAVRAGLSAWIDRMPADVAGKGFPNALAYALAQSGEARDFLLFRRLVRRHPEHASYVNDETLILIRRVGGAAVAPLAADLLKDDAPCQAEQPAEKILRRLDPAVPAPTHADDFVRTMTKSSTSP